MFFFKVNHNLFKFFIIIWLIPSIIHTNGFPNKNIALNGVIKLYDGTKIEENMAFPVNINCYDSNGSIIRSSENDFLNITWKVFNFSLRFPFGAYQILLTERNESGYWGKMIEFEGDFYYNRSKLNEYQDRSEIINLTKTLFWMDENHSQEFYYKEALRYNALSNSTCYFDQESNEFVLSELGDNGSIISKSVISTINGYAKSIAIFNTSSIIRGKPLCNHIELVFPVFPPESKAIDPILVISIFFFIITIFLIVIFRFKR